MKRTTNRTTNRTTINAARLRFGATKEDAENWTPSLSGKYEQAWYRDFKMGAEAGEVQNRVWLALWGAWHALPPTCSMRLRERLRVGRRNYRLSIRKFLSGGTEPMMEYKLARE